jgi:hypothetical protein
MYIPPALLVRTLLSLTYVLNQCPQISYPGQAVGFVTDAQIDEASGLLSSQFNPNYFWTINDSDGVPCLFAITMNGTLQYRLCLTGASNLDWEAIATAPCNKGYSNDNDDDILLMKK